MKLNYKQPILNNEDEDIDCDPSRVAHLGYFEAKKELSKISVYLDEQIKQPDYYRQLIHRIRNADEHDIVEIYISSYGGSLDGALALIEAIENTDANVLCVITGMAASAASLIALASPNISVSPRASMMLHQASFGSFGKQSDILNHANFVDKKVRSLMQEMYEGFLSKKELEELFMGREIWMEADEIIDRLHAKQEYFEIKQQKEEKEKQLVEEQNISATKVAKPKRATKKKQTT